MVRRPADLKYAAGERPPLTAILTLALQYIAVLAVYPATTLPVILFLKPSPEVAASVICWTFIFQAIGTILFQAKESPITGGQPLFAANSAVYLAPSLVAAKIGGLPLVFGMTIFSGVVRMAISPFLGRLRALFTAEIGHMVVMVIGLGVAAFGVRWSFETFEASGGDWVQIALTAGVVTLIYLISGLFKGTIGSTGFLVAYLIGYAVATVFHRLDPTTPATIANASWFALPRFAPGGYAFDSSLAVLFVIVTIVCSIKIVGSATVTQQLQDADWSRPRMRNIARLNFIDGLTAALSGMCGGTGFNVSPAGVALVAANKTASRIVGYVFAFFCLCLAACNKVAVVLSVSPKAVLAGMLIYLGAVLFISSFQYLMPRLHETRIALTSVVALFLGVGYHFYPRLYHDLPPLARQFTASSLAVATAFALFLNFFFHMRLEVNRKTYLMYDRSDESLDHMARFVNHYGELWQVTPKALERCVNTLISLSQKPDLKGRIRVVYTVDEIGLHLSAIYHGGPLDGAASDLFSVVAADTRSDGRQEIEMRFAGR